MGRVLGSSRGYPAQRQISLGEFQLNVLPKARQQTRVPQHLVAKFQSFYVYPISLKITQVCHPRPVCSFISIIHGIRISSRTVLLVWNFVCMDDFISDQLR